MRPLIAALAALTFISGAAAATPIYWTPAHMTKALTTLSYPHPGVLGGVCRGVGKARHGAFTGFRCAMTWQVIGTNGQATTDGRVTVWAKPLKGGRVCGSTASLARCAPLAAGPLPGDPSVCSGQTGSSCVIANAVEAMRRHVGGSGGLYQGETSCQISSMAAARIVLACMAGSTAETVTYVKGISQWTVAVTP